MFLFENLAESFSQDELTTWRASRSNEADYSYDHFRGVDASVREQEKTAILHLVPHKAWLLYGKFESVLHNSVAPEKKSPISMLRVFLTSKPEACP